MWCGPLKSCATQVSPALKNGGPSLSCKQDKKGKVISQALNIQAVRHWRSSSVWKSHKERRSLGVPGWGKSCVTSWMESPHVQHRAAFLSPFPPSLAPDLYLFVLSHIPFLSLLISLLFLLLLLPPFPQVRVPKGHCWIEGDNHRKSIDSNEFGPVPLGLIQSKAVGVLWPRDRRQFLTHEIAHESAKRVTPFTDEEETWWQFWTFLRHKTCVVKPRLLVEAHLETLSLWNE